MATLSHLAAFTHDCDTCRLIAHVQPAFGQCFDLYCHENNDGYDNTIIARIGNEGPDYLAMPDSIANRLDDTDTTMGQAAWIMKNHALARKLMEL